MVVFVGASTVWGVVGSGFGSAESCRIWLLVPSVLKNLRGLGRWIRHGMRADYKFDAFRHRPPSRWAFVLACLGRSCK